MDAPTASLHSLLSVLGLIAHFVPQRPSPSLHTRAQGCQVGTDARLDHTACV